MQQIANRAGVSNVLVGGYVKAGNTIRISARLQDAKTGRIVSAARVEGPGESSLFSLVDELMRRFKSTISTLGGPTQDSLLARPGQTLDYSSSRRPHAPGTGGKFTGSASRTATSTRRALAIASVACFASTRTSVP